MSFSRTPRFWDPPPKEKPSPNKKPRKSSSPQFPYPIQQVSPVYGSYLEYLEKEYSPPKSASPKPISTESSSSTPTRKKKEETSPYTSYLDYLEKEFNKNYKPFISHRSSKSPNNSPKSPIRDTGTTNEPEKRPSKSNSPTVHTECTPLKRDTSTRNTSQRKSLDSTTTKQHTPLAEPKYRDHHLSHNFDSSKTLKRSNSNTQTKPQTTNKHNSPQDNSLKKENNSSPNLQTQSENSSSDSKSLQQTNNKHNASPDNSLKKENNTTVHESSPNVQAQTENSSLDSKSLEHGMNPPENEGKLEPSTPHEAETRTLTIREEKPVPILESTESDSSIHVGHSSTDESTIESNSKQQNGTNEGTPSTKEKPTPQTTTDNVTVTQSTPTTVSKTEAPVSENMTILKTISVESTSSSSPPKMESKDTPSKEDTTLMSSGALRQMIAQKLQRTKESGASSLESSPVSSPRPKRDSALAVEELRRRIKPNATSAVTSSPAILTPSPHTPITTKQLSVSDSDLLIVKESNESTPPAFQPPVIVNQIQHTTTEPTISSTPEPSPSQTTSAPSTTSSTPEVPQSKASTTTSSTLEAPQSQANSTAPSESVASSESPPPSGGPPPPPPPPVVQSPKSLSIKKAKDAPVKKPTSTMDELQQRIAQRRASMDLTAVTQVPTITPSTKSTAIPTTSTRIPIATKTTATPPQTQQQASAPPVVPDAPDGGPPPPPPPPPVSAPKTPAKKTTTTAAKPKPVNTMDELKNKLSLRQNLPTVDIEKKLLENKQNAQMASPRLPSQIGSPRVPGKNSTPSLKNAGPINHMMELQNAIAMRQKK